MDAILSGILAAPITWPQVCALALFFLFLAWREYLHHVRELGQAGHLARFPDSPPPPPTKPATGAALPLLGILLVVGLGMAAAAIQAHRIAARPTSCGPCPSPAVCTPQGCRGVGAPAPAPPPEPAQQSRNDPRKVSDLDSPYWPAAFPWHPGDLDVN